MTEHPALSDPEYSTPGTSRGMLSVFKHRYLLSLLLKKDITTRYYGSILGWAWSYIRPLAQFFMYFVVIGLLLGVNRSIDKFPVYLFSGIIMVNLFSETFRSITTSITGNKALIRKIYLPRELFAVAAALQAIIHFLPQAAVLLVVCIALGWTVTWVQILAFLCAIVVVSLWGLGLGLFFGAFNVAYRDSRNIVDLILMFATWTAPVLYSFERVKDQASKFNLEWVYHLYMSNPVASAVELSHTMFWAPVAEDPARPSHLMTYVLIGFALTLIAVLIGQLAFRKMEGQFAQNL